MTQRVEPRIVYEVKLQANDLSSNLRPGKERDAKVSTTCNKKKLFTFQKEMKKKLTISTE